jgi:predicted transposase/invertase (TIGR01784 family)
MLITAVRKEKQSFFDKGKREGKREGRVQVARNMLAKGFAVALIAEVTGLSAEKIVKLKPMMMEQ